MITDRIAEQLKNQLILVRGTMSGIAKRDVEAGTVELSFYSSYKVEGSIYLSRIDYPEQSSPGLRAYNYLPMRTTGALVSDDDWSQGMVNL